MQVQQEIRARYLVAGHDKVTLVFTVLIVENYHDLTLAQSKQGIIYAVKQR